MNANDFDATLAEIRVLVADLVADAQASENQVGWRRGYDAASQDFRLMEADRDALAVERDALRLEVEALKCDLAAADRGHQCEGGCPRSEPCPPPTGMVPAEPSCAACGKALADHWHRRSCLYVYRATL